MLSPPEIAIIQKSVFQRIEEVESSQSSEVSLSTWAKSFWTVNSRFLYLAASSVRKIEGLIHHT